MANSFYTRVFLVETQRYETRRYETAPFLLTPSEPRKSLLKQIRHHGGILLRAWIFPCDQGLLLAKMLGAFDDKSAARRMPRSHHLTSLLFSFM